jgi:hypothetical protein
MNEFEKMGSIELSPAVEDTIQRALVAFQKGAKELRTEATDLEEHTEAGTLRELKEATRKYMKENPGEFPDEFILWDMVTTARKERREKSKGKEEAGEVVETGGVI